MRVALLAGLALALATLAATSWSGSRGSTPRGAADGRSLFAAKGCGTCHIGPDAGGRSVQAGPSLGSIASQAGSRRPGLSAEAFVRQSILEPGAFLSPNPNGGPSWKMPKLTVSADEADALVDYLLRRDA